MRRGHRGRSTTDLGLGLRTELGRTERWEMENELGGMERRKMDSEGVGEEDLQLAYLLPWSECPVSSQGMPAGVVGWDKAMSGRGFRRR